MPNVFGRPKSPTPSLLHGFACGHPPPSGAFGSQSCSSLPPHDALHSDDAPVAVFWMQQTCPLGQFAEALHFRDATLMSPPPPPPASGTVHPGDAAAQP